MLLDFVPESLAMGGVFTVSASAGPLLAIFIGLQNLPEGFSAFRELNAQRGARPRRILLLMGAMVPIAPALSLVGFLFLSGHTAVLGVIMLFASGGILYLIFQDIAPQSRLDRHWAPPLGAVLGFAVGILVKLLFE